MTGGCTTRTDTYFSPYTGDQDKGARTCNFGASVDVDWGNRTGSGNNFQVIIGGVNLDASRRQPDGRLEHGGNAARHVDLDGRAAKRSAATTSA